MPDDVLALIDADIVVDPECLQPFDDPLLDRIAALVKDVEIDLDAPLSPEDE